MSQAWTIGAQLSTSHSSADALGVEPMLAAVERAKTILDLRILIVGAREIPEVFARLTEARSRPADQVFLWYNLLSDIPDMQPSELVVNWRGEASRGWGGWAEKGAEVDETFRFACPNHPGVRRKTLERLRELLTRYAFDGVFLDKLRFPSPANGIEEVASCFCDHCRAAAAPRGLDLDAMARHIEEGRLAEAPAAAGDAGPSGDWLLGLVGQWSLLAEFLRFRSESITTMVRAAHDLALALGRHLSLDLFSPGLATLVGQDYGGLAGYAAWAKPMTYRVARGPAGLRLEIPTLVEGVSRLCNLREDSIGAWAAHHVPGFGPDTLRETRDVAVPIGLMTAEIAAAVRLMGRVPVYFGLELVSHPGVIEITPSLVGDMVRAGRQGGAAGAIISWDLMHAPRDGLQALASLLSTSRE